MTSHIRSENGTVLPLPAVSQPRRALPLISQLPTELLIHTVHLALPSVDVMAGDAAINSRSHMRMLYTTRRVAKRWQEIIDGTPSFWVVILSTFPHHVINTTITRSAYLPLTVVFEHGLQYELHPEEFLQAIAHTRSRWSAIFLDIDNDKCRRGFLGTSAPLLQTLVVRPGRGKQLELLGGQTNNLRDVNISGTSIRWKIGLFTQLKSLILTDIAHDGLTTSHILDFLSASPCLECLHIGGVNITPAAPPSSQIITLPYLKYIRLQCDSSIVTDSILRQIQTPSCSQFIVGVGNEDGFDPIHFLNETLRPFERILRELHVQKGASELLIQPFEFRWRSSPWLNDEYGFSVSITDFLDPLAIRWVERILQKEPGLRIPFGSRVTLDQAVLEALAPMQCVTRVFVVGQRGEVVRRALHFLGTLLSPSSSLPSFPCLRELLISSLGWSAQDLLDAVEFRSSACPYHTIDRPNLAIKIRRRAFTLNGSPGPIFDLALLSKIRAAEGVESFQFVGTQDADGTLAITWNEEASEPTWG